MRANHVKSKVLSGGTSLGTMMFEFNTTGVARIAAAAGAEFAVYDMEHTGWTLETIRMLFATTRSTNMIPMVRIPATEYHFVARVLDIGAMGIMVPMVESAEQARRMVQYAKYPPIGRRGAAFGVAHDDYQGGDIVAKMDTSNREVLLIAQIETVEGLRNVEEIAAVEHIDVLWIGHFDLTNSLGIPGQFQHPQFLGGVEKVLEACRRHKKVPAFMASDVPSAQALLRQGFRMLAYGGDLWLYQSALAQGIATLRQQA